MNFRRLTTFALLAGAALMGLLVLGPSSAMAQLEDPQLYVCTGCGTKAPGGDANTIDPGSVLIGINANNKTALAPLLVIVGVPEGGADPMISLPAGVGLMAAANYYGAATNDSTLGELDATMTASGCKDAYACVNLNHGDSESFTNWTSPFPINPSTNPDTSVTGFNLYVYAINYSLDSGTGGNSPITIAFKNLDFGSYVIGYACQTAAPCTGNAIEDTPFTNAGVDLTPNAPEASAVTLTSLVLLAFGALLVRSRRNA